MVFPAEVVENITKARYESSVVRSAVANGDRGRNNYRGNTSQGNYRSRPFFGRGTTRQNYSSGNNNTNQSNLNSNNPYNNSNNSTTTTPNNEYVGHQSLFQAKHSTTSSFSHTTTTSCTTITEQRTLRDSGRWNFTRRKSKHFQSYCKSTINTLGQYQSSARDTRFNGTTTDTMEDQGEEKLSRRTPSRCRSSRKVPFRRDHRKITITKRGTPLKFLHYGRTNKKKTDLGLQDTKPICAMPTLPDGRSTSPKRYHTVEEGDLLSKIDLKDAYTIVPIHKDSRRYLTFKHNGTVYQYKSLAFGLSVAPRVFSKLMRYALEPLREEGIRLVYYLDDICILARSKEEMQICANRLIDHLTKLGFLINWEKSILTPSRIQDFLGFSFDTRSMRIKVPQMKMKKLFARIKQAKGSMTRSCRWIAGLLGKMTAMTPAVGEALLHIRYIQRDLAMNLRRTN